MPVEDTRTLNQGQQEVADGFFQFLLSDQKEMIISGPAGVGKTYLLGYLIDRVMPMYHDACKLMGLPARFTEVQMTATTNKAAEVLSYATKRPVSTIQSFLGLKVKDDYNTGRSNLTKTHNWQVHTNKILIIEECSMIDSNLDLLIQEGTQDCKIIYVGDHCQIAPIMEPLSPIYLRGLKSYELTEPVRNAEQPALMNLCNQLRLTVETGEFMPIQIVPGVIDWVSPEEMQALIDSTFAQQTDQARILAYTNQRVHDYNEYIRDVRKLPNHYVEGEKLVNSQAIRLDNKQLSVEEAVTIHRMSQSETTVYITPEVKLSIHFADLITNVGGLIPNVPIPTDREYFHNLLKYYNKTKNWKIFFQLKNTYPDLRPGDSSTFHKAQGSTYDTVFIDAENLSTCHQPNNVARMLYVAASRPRNRIIFYGNLAPKYGGLHK